MGHNKGHLGLLQDPSIYLACNGAAFTIPANEPPTYPVIPTGATTQAREELCATNIATSKAWATYHLVLAITRDQFAATINDAYYAVLDDPTEGLNGINLRTLVQHILTTYIQISQPDLDDNMNEFNIGIDPSLPLAIYTRKQEKCQVFAANAGVTISDELMVTTGSKHALSSSNMTLGWREWKCLPAIQHTWDNWKIHWMAAFAKMRDISRMTTGKTTFGANQAVEIKQVLQMATSLDNLANGSIQKRQPRCHKRFPLQGHPRHSAYSCHDDDQSNSHTGHTHTPRLAYRRSHSPTPLDHCQTSLGQNRVVLVPRLKSEGRSRQLHVHIS